MKKRGRYKLQEKIFPGVLGGTIVTVLAEKGCLIEKMSSVGLCSETLMCILTKTGAVKIRGIGLQLGEMRDESVNITGKITAIEFED